MNQPGDGSLEEAVIEAASRLEVSVDEVWKMISTGDLSVQETAEGQWTIPDWSVNYLITDRSKETDTGTEPRRVAAVSPPRPEPTPKKKSKRIDPAKKWKQQFDELGRRKNELMRQLRALQRNEDVESKKRIPSLNGMLHEALQELERHMKDGVKAGYVELPKHRGKKKRPEKPPVFSLEQLGIQGGIFSPKEWEILNTYDPRRGLELWEKPSAAFRGKFQRPGN
jgi:hypothetical protein